MVQITIIYLEREQLNNWLHDVGYINLEDTAYCTSDEVKAKYAESRSVEPFRDWCTDNYYFDKWTINHWYGTDGWDYEVVEIGSDDVVLLILAFNEY